MHLYRLRILPTIPYDCYLIPCLFQLISFPFFWHIFFSSLTPSSEFVYDHQINFRRSHYTHIYIYSYLHFLIYIYLFIRTFCLYYYMKLIKLLIKYGKYRNHNEILQIEECFYYWKTYTEMEVFKSNGSFSNFNPNLPNTSFIHKMTKNKAQAF